jgi:hypothetical protein
MSAALAMAATSEVLRFLVKDALTRAASDLQFPAPAVTTGAPPRPNQQTNVDVPAVNLFLHHTTPNPAGRNMAGPTRDARGQRLNNAPLILDLHYLLSAHGPEALREIGFGTAMHALHQAGIVPRDLIRRSLDGLKNDLDGNKQAVARSNLADQVESLTITSEALDIDAITKIWTAIQSPYRPSAGILVTTVILEDVRPSRVPLPVLNSGVAPAPVRELSIAAVEGRKAGLRWPITVEADLVVDGAGFADATLAASIADAPLDIVVAESNATALKLRFMPATIATLRAGPQLLKLSISTDVDGRAMLSQSAVAAVSLLPTLSVPAIANVAVTPNDANSVTGALDVTVSPPVSRTQSAVLMLTPVGAGTDQAIAWAAPAPVSPHVDAFTVLSFALKRIPRGTYLARLNVDGTTSQPMPDNAGAFQPRVTL